jgi:hypothetical protein
MRKLLTLKSLLVCCTVLAFASCQREGTSFSVVPNISFKEFIQNPDGTATCSINFTDGDGDIGLNDKDVNPPYNPGSKYNSNLYLVFYCKDASGSWQPFNNGTPPRFDTLEFPYRIPYLTQNGQKQSLQGEIKVKLNGPYSPLFSGQPFKFKITLIDRALHISNEVETNVLTTP